MSGDAAFLDSLSGDDAVRYRVFLDSSFSPEVMESLLAGALPPAALHDAGARRELLLALASSARVFAVEVSEAAVALRAADGGLGGAVKPGHVAEAWRLRVLAGFGLPTGNSASGARVVDVAASELVKAKRVKR